MKQRNVAFDIARALCVIWIVAFWHYKDFIDNAYFNKIVSDALHGEYLTSGVLSCFMFMSGFFLKKYKFDNIRDIKIFAEKRFWRFYILLFFAACLMLLPNLQLLKFLTLITGLSVFLHNQPQTLWFFGDLMFFYYLTPFLLWKDKPLTIKIIKSVSIWCAFFLLYYLLDINIRVVMYFPFYMMGLLITEKIVNHLSSWLSLIIMTIGVIICYLLPWDVYPLYQVFVTAFIISVSYQLAKLNHVFIILFNYISYSSMCVYLYHKVIFVHIANKLDFSGGAESASFIIAVFVIGYIIQKSYDLLLEKIIKK